MDALDIADFLDRQRTGVLSLAKEDAGYAVPVSFVYDDDGPSVFLRLGFGPGSQKRAFVEAADRVTFVVYAETDEGWKSVVAEGRLEELSRTSLDSSIVEAVEGLDIPFFSIHRRPASDLEFRLYRVDVSSLSGVAEVGGRASGRPQR